MVDIFIEASFIQSVLYSFQNMLKFQASKRLSAEDALHHPYLSKNRQDNEQENEEEGEGEEGYHTPDSTQHTSTSSPDNSSQLDISNSSDSGILPDSCPS